MFIDCVIVNWNSGAQLQACVNSLVAYGSDMISKIYIVDNGSNDGSDHAIKNSEKLDIVRTGINLGFGKACNFGASIGNSEFILFINPDTKIYADTLLKSLKYLKAPERSLTGICGVQLLNESGRVSRSCARFPTALGIVAHTIGVDRLFPRFGHFMAEWDHGESRKVDHVIGAFFLVRRSVFELLGGFDERFFLYYEDLDFSYRAYQAGWSTTYLADVQAFHAGGGTSRQVKSHRLFYSLRSRLLYSFKYFTWCGAAAVLLATLFLEPVSRSVLASMQRSGGSFKETWVAYGMLWRWLPRWVFKGETC